MYLKFILYLTENTVYIYYKVQPLKVLREIVNIYSESHKKLITSLSGINW
jgi:hypothetical protein